MLISFFGICGLCLTKLDIQQTQTKLDSNYERRVVVHSINDVVLRLRVVVQLYVCFRVVCACSYIHYVEENASFECIVAHQM